MRRARFINYALFVCDMRGIFVFVIAALLLFLTSCANNAIVAESANETILQKISEEQKCKTTTCSANQKCIAGNCVCEQRFKDCNGKCIPSRACCTEADCEEGAFCNQENTCKSYPKQCAYNQEWNITNETCTCIQGTKFCEPQNKCIPSKNCCVPSDCTFRRNLCSDTNYIASVCIKDETKHCKSINEGRNELFSLKDDTYFRIHVNNIVEKGSTNIIVNKNISKKLLFNTSTQLTDNLTIFVDEIKELGGVCKTYEQ